MAVKFEGTDSIEDAIRAARPEINRDRDTPQMRVIRGLSRRGILLGTVETALLPALYAATSPEAEGGRLYGPDGFMNLGGGPAEQELYRPLRDPADAVRIWRISQELTRVPFPSPGSARPHNVNDSAAPSLGRLARSTPPGS